jgi:DNA modification methylase
MTDYTLWLGNCLEQMDRIEDSSIDAIVCDLPYGRTNCSWDIVIPFEPLWKQYKRVIKRSGAVVLFGSEPFSSLLRLSNLEWYRYDLIWDKLSIGAPGVAKFRPLPSHENISIFSIGSVSYNPQMVQGKPYHGKNTPRKYRYGNNLKLGFRDNGKSEYDGMRFPLSIISINAQISECNNTNRLHPTQKPVALLSYLIKTYTNEGEIVLDNTCGSGSTLEAAMRTGRHSIGIEKDAHYFGVATQRLERVAAELRGELNHLPLFAEMPADAVKM